MGPSFLLKARPTANRRRFRRICFAPRTPTPKDESAFIVKAAFPPKSSPSARRVLNAQNCDPSKQIDVNEVCVRVVGLAQAMRERLFYPYQVEVSHRITESLLLHDNEILTVLMARQLGKTEVIGSTCAALATILPYLAAMFPDDWHLNMTDDLGVYRGYRYGLSTGIYAPRLDQAGIMFDRVKMSFDTKTAKGILKSLNLQVSENNGNTFSLSSGSSVLCESASEQSKIEGATHQLLIVEEAQDVSDLKVRKSLHPMVAATGGTIVKVGTATIHKCDFYTAIQHNKRQQVATGVQNHFFYPASVGIKYNSLYAKTIEKERLRLGVDSDEYRTSYDGQWIFERGMFVTAELLFDRGVAQSSGVWSERRPQGISQGLSKRYSIVAGIDWGASHDSTVVTLVAVDWDNPVEEGEAYTGSGLTRYTYYKKHVLDWMAMVGDNYEHQFFKVLEYLSHVKGLRVVVSDSNTCGRPIYDRLCAALAGSGIEVREFNFQPRLKSDGYRLLSSDFYGRRITFPAGPQFRDRHYLAFTYQMLDLQKTFKNGLMVVAHPPEKGAHDDYPDSLMMANWAANTRSVLGDISFHSVNPFFS